MSQALSVDLTHGFESVVLEYFFTNFIPDIFLRVQFGRIRGEDMQDDIGRDLEFVAAVIAGSVLTIPLISNEPVNIGKKRLFEHELGEFFHEGP